MTATTSRRHLRRRERVTEPHTADSERRQRSSSNGPLRRRFRAMPKWLGSHESTLRRRVSDLLIPFFGRAEKRPIDEAVCYAPEPVDLMTLGQVRAGLPKTDSGFRESNDLSDSLRLESGPGIWPASRQPTSR